MPIFTQIPDALATTIAGNAGNDVLAGFDGDDYLFGGAGDDLFFEGRGPWEQPSTAPFVQGLVYGYGFGSDTINGGSGQDTLSFAGSTPAIGLHLEVGGSGSLSRQGEIDVFSRIETIILGSGADTIALGGARFHVDSGAGNDLFRGLSRGTTLDGGAGTDSFDLTIAPTGTTRVTVNLTTGVGPEDMLLRNIENLTGVAIAEYRLTGDAARNALTGGTLNDTLRGEAGDDTLIGGAGNDRLYGGDENDLLEGYGGRDVLFGGAGRDDLRGGDDTGLSQTIFYGGEGDDRVSASTGHAVIYGGTGKDVIIGNTFSTKAYGGDGSDKLTGGSNNDTLRGDDGSDSIFGEFGNDTIHGGRGQDFLSGGFGDDLIFGGPGGDTLHGAEGNDTLSAVGDFVVHLHGDLGDDLLTVNNGYGGGGDGNDTLIGLGGGGLSGGDGNDLFQLASARSMYAIGGAGDDQFELTGKREGLFAQLAQQVLFGGEGLDSLHVEEGSVQVRSAVLFGGGGGVVAHTDIETLTFGEGRIELLVERDVEFGEYILNGANSFARMMGSYGSVIFTSGGNTAILSGLETSFSTTGIGRDTVTIFASADFAKVETGADSDTILLDNGTSTVNTGAGADVMTVQSFSGSFPSGSINMGSGNDSLTLSGDFREITLGSGNDTLFIGEGAQSDLLTAGAGADTFVIDPYVTGATIQILDFVLGQDRISRPDATSLADVDTMTEEASAVRLFFRSDSLFAGENQGTVIYLHGLTIAQLTDDIFL